MAIAQGFDRFLHDIRRRLPEGTSFELADFLKLPRAAEVLSYHVVPGQRYLKDDLLNGTELVTNLPGRTVGILRVPKVSGDRTYDSISFVDDINRKSGAKAFNRLVGDGIAVHILEKVCARGSREPSKQLA